MTVAIACGSVGDPRPPLLNLPLPVQDLSVRQVGTEIQVSWSWPVTTTEGTIARQVGAFTLWAVDVPGFSNDLSPETIDEYRRSVMTIGRDDLSDRQPGDRLSVNLPLEDWQLGQTTLLVVKVSNATGRDAGYSNQARVHPLQPPGATEWSGVTVTAEGVALSWPPTAHAEEYAVERSTGDGPTFQTLGRLAATSFLDRTVLWNTTYSYRLRPHRSSEAGWVEGPLSPMIDVTPKDTFPPSPPTGLRAVRTEASVELSWQPSADQDVAGYLVHRNGEVVSALVTGLSYSDAAVPVDSAVEYAVSAVDAEGNQGQPGASLSVTASRQRAK